MANEYRDGYGSKQPKIPSSNTRGYKKKSLDIVHLDRSGDVDKAVFETYRKSNIVEVMEGPIESIMLKKKIIRVLGRIKTDDLFLYNTGKCITTVSLPSKHSKYIFVGVKKGFERESTFKFSSEASEVYLFDQELNLRRILSFSFGYCRKIEARQEEDVIRCVALFSDGFIRRFDFEGEIRNMVQLETSGVVNFEIDWDEDIIFATDGGILVWIRQNSVVSVFNEIKGMITSIAIKKKTRKGKDGEHSTGSPNKGSLCFYALGLNGKIFRFGNEFQEEERISFPSGYTFIKYLSQTDTVIIVDTLNNVTKILHDEGSHRRATVMFNYSLSCCRPNEKKILIGGFDGTIKHGKINKRKTKTKTLFQLVRKGNEVMLVHSEEELKAFDPKGRLFNDSSERVIDLWIGETHLFAAYECGIVVGFSLL
ncbi:uncharacterized protein Eint_031170 [Encephalitozoon intestinalis ATCC 50506]|uniref:WD40 domain-containing protein n=1 Tax=Encephalitozoon intestinalis (strain ATCC 50506) TaxID=876142 RepID=E0S6C5_ENCIT|nr:uncharacterized protein Eint_031170 [Encephalitozoon intestinalis ATCC 50506]ADM11260.1 hypothetical protein Eint_031170 [Encephalitozoon intestinalis ATCC 50506]UTX44928.1 WD40 domain-containing protein [Encephalitozoon intestinalis]